MQQAPSAAASWSQTPDEVLLRLRVPPETRGKDVSFEAHPERLAVALRGGESLAAGSLADAGDVDVDGALHSLQAARRQGAQPGARPAPASWRAPLALARAAFFAGAPAAARQSAPLPLLHTTHYTLHITHYASHNTHKKLLP